MAGQESSPNLQHPWASLLASRSEDGLSRSFALPKWVNHGRSRYNHDPRPDPVATEKAG